MIPIRTTAPTRYPPFVTWTLIGINCFVFFVQLGLTPAELEEFLVRFALIPARYSLQSALTPDDFIPFITMMFLHGGWLHLIMNMWMLWLFGPAVEDRLGHSRFLLFYLGCGIAAALAQMASDPYSVIPALGASGAIAGILGCTMSLFPLSRVIVVCRSCFCRCSSRSTPSCSSASGFCFKSSREQWRCWNPRKAASPGGRMSAGSWPDCSSDRCCSGPSAVIASISPTKASSDLIRGDADEWHRCNIFAE
jgi:membrane associated rhomboid family serine protease